MMAGIAVMLSASLLVGAQDAGDAATIKEVEKALKILNDAFTNQDAVTIRRLMIEEHVAVTPYYGLANKAEELRSLSDLKLTEYKASGMKVTLIARDAALITYSLKLDGTFKGKSVASRNHVVAVWVKRDGNWQEASYQETPIDGK